MYTLDRSLDATFLLLDIMLYAGPFAPWWHRIAQIRYRWSGQSILVTGGTGFIGTAIVQTLLALGADRLTVVARKPHHVHFQPHNVIALDLCDHISTRRLLSGSPWDLIINAAGRIDHSVGPDICRSLYEANVLTTLNLLEACAAKQPRRFVHIGSATEYGSGSCPQSSSDRETPLTWYGAAKLAATKLVLARSAAESYPAVVVRPFLVYGPGQAAGSFLARAIEAARSRQTLRTTPCQQTRDFVSIARVVFDILAAAADPIPPHSISNSCTGVEISLCEVLDLLATRYPGFTPLYGALPYRSGELMRSVGVPRELIAPDEVRHELISFLEQEIESPVHNVA